MGGHPGDSKMRKASGQTIGFHCLLEPDAKFGFFQAGGDVRMGVCINVRIDPNGNGRNLAQCLRHLVQPVQLAHRLDIETMDPGPQGPL